MGSAAGRFRITHRFHPRCGAEHELVTRRLNWGEDRVFYYDPDGKLKSLMANVTDVAAVDAFDRISPLAGRRLAELVHLAATTPAAHPVCAQHGQNLIG